MNIEQLRKELEVDEGVKYEIYNDHLGYPTFGIGHLVRDSDPEAGAALGTPVSEDRVIEAFNADVETVLNDCTILYDDFDDLPEEAQLIIANMMFNLGRPRLSKFKGMKAGVDSRDWNKEVFDLYYEMDLKYKDSYLNKFKDRDTNSKMSLRLEDYEGEYISDMYGRIIIKKDDEKMTLDINNGIKFFDLDWWEYDIFITDKDEKWREKLFVNFNIEDNKVYSLKIYNEEFKKVN